MTDALSGKTALVTGASRGIGLAIAQRFAEAGAKVLAADLNVAEIDVADDASIVPVQADVTDAGNLSAALDAALDGGRLDVCVANAGVFTEQAGFLAEDPAAWRRVIEVNLTGAMITLQVAARKMVEGGHGGRLLATSSAAGVRGERGWPAYCASKAGLVRAVESIAIELGEHGITVNAVAPGEVDTEMHRAVVRERGEAGPGGDLAVLLKAGVPLDRPGTTREIADAFVFLASDAASYITGHTLAVDGGALLV